MSTVGSKYDMKLILISTAIVVFLAFVFLFFANNAKVAVRVILEASITSFLLGVITVLIFIINYFKNKRKSIEAEPIITKKFGAFIDNILGGITYATTITTSLTLLKGLYIQTFFKDKTYFLEFEKLDLVTIFGVALFLLYVSFMKVIEIAKETYKVEQTEQVRNEQGQVVLTINSQDKNKV